MNPEFPLMDSAYYAGTQAVNNGLTQQQQQACNGNFETGHLNFGNTNYQTSCDFENSLITAATVANNNVAVHNIAQQGYNETMIVLPTSATGMQAQQLLAKETTLSYSCNDQIFGQMQHQRTFSSYPAGKHGFAGRPISNHKRSRTVFQPHQIRRLQYEFEREMYMVGMKRRNLSKELDLSEKQIKIWFQNRRMKQKRERNRRHQRRGFDNLQNVFANNDNFFGNFDLGNAVKIAVQQRGSHGNQMLILQ